MKTVAIIQSRMGSTRLPGKVLKDIAGQSVLARVVQRLRRANLIDELLIATTTLACDDAIVAECERCAVEVFRGDHEDVLERYHCAAQVSNADVIVRITSDCPLIEPEITDKTIAAFFEAKPDYASNTLIRTYPRGLDTEVFSIDALHRARQQAKKPYEREHVTPYIYEHPDEFRILPVTGKTDYSSYRWTVDTSEDLEFVRAVYAFMASNAEFSWADTIHLLESKPELLDVNRTIAQKSLHHV